MLGGYLSPVNAGYQKAGLARAEDRLRMCELAAKDSALVLVDAWEATQPGYQRTLPVLQHFTAALADAVAQAAAAQVLAETALTACNEPSLILSSKPLVTHPLEAVNPCLECYCTNYYMKKCTTSLYA